MTVKIVNGKLVVDKTATTNGNGKAKKYPYPNSQYDQLLKLAKTAGIDIGSTSASKTKAANTVTRAIIDAFIADTDKPKAEQT